MPLDVPYKGPAAIEYAVPVVLNKGSRAIALPSSIPDASPPHLILLHTSSSIPNTSALRPTSTIFHIYPSQVAYEMAPARPLKTMECEKCRKSVLSANYARHVKKAHAGLVIDRVRKLKQFKCLLCHNYFALKMKSRHFRNKHPKEAGSNIPVNGEEGESSKIPTLLSSAV